MILTPALERVKMVAASGRAASEPKDRHLWDALDSAITITEKHLPTLEALGEEGLRSAMRMWLAPAPFEARLAMVRGATMTELAEGNVRQAWELDQDTEKRAEVKRELVEWLTNLGIVGVRLLLSVALV